MVEHHFHMKKWKEVRALYRNDAPAVSKKNIPKILCNYNLCIIKHLKRWHIFQWKMPVIRFTSQQQCYDKKQT
ncbi:hypothetical protein A4R26_31890 [Niastella populi]|uniref:Uncharacterized protein n=1 Tax=Niastella populi TaxID=550983 RepID=A0A1V9ENX0_9BACT|nr:hypothetical protein A4R26_31890 [Niastella populi]